ncbi:hypothetical protein M514_21641 [Trichuris suis]|uniref:Uncharacterized protein n=1 Tax=Trichuris suis TaxID=68888 RepID=A0A085N9I1_9BILA|nr:hypothetical protein M514_21641 [Trichuris suis]
MLARGAMLYELRLSKECCCTICLSNEHLLGKCLRWIFP